MQRWRFRWNFWTFCGWTNQGSGWKFNTWTRLQVSIHRPLNKDLSVLRPYFSVYSRGGGGGPPPPPNAMRRAAINKLNGDSCCVKRSGHFVLCYLVDHKLKRKEEKKKRDFSFHFWLLLFIIINMKLNWLSYWPITAPYLQLIAAPLKPIQLNDLIIIS